MGLIRITHCENLEEDTSCSILINPKYIVSVNDDKPDIVEKYDTDGWKQIKMFAKVRMINGDEYKVEMDDEFYKFMEGLNLFG